MHQVGGAVEDGGLALVHELDLQRVVLVAHDFQLLSHIVSVTHHEGVEVTEAEDGVLGFIGDDDGYAHRVERDFLHEVVDHILQHGLQVSVDLRLVVIKVLNGAVAWVDFYGRVFGIGAFHLLVEDFLLVLCRRKVAFEDDIVLGVGDD